MALSGVSYMALGHLDIAPSLLDWIVAVWTAIKLLMRNLVIPV